MKGRREGEDNSHIRENAEGEGTNQNPCGVQHLIQCQLTSLTNITHQVPLQYGHLLVNLYI